MSNAETFTGLIEAICWRQTNKVPRQLCRIS